MRFFILANGKATRWNNYMGVDKQLIVIDGEPILNRTIRLLKENGQNDIYIIGKYKVKGAKNYIPKFESEIGKYDITKDLWSDIDGFVLLYGDCYYSEAIIKDICKRPVKKHLHWTCNRENKITGKPYPEGYAHKIGNIEWWAGCCSFYHTGIENGTIRHEIDWCFLRFLLGIDLYVHQPELMKEQSVDWEDETDDFDYPIDYDRWMEHCRK